MPRENAHDYRSRWVGQVETDLLALQRENALLREEVWVQWEANHYEHCSYKWPHPEGRFCKWPLPDLLRGPTRF